MTSSWPRSGRPRCSSPGGSVRRRTRSASPTSCAWPCTRSAELDQLVADPASLAAEVREREATYAELLTLEPPFVFAGEPPSPATWARRDARLASVVGPGDVLQGLPGCPGRARGRARVVLDSHDPTALEPGDVLVAPITDPSWTPLFVPAAAVIVDVGAPLSHAIIVSREL